MIQPACVLPSNASPLVGGSEPPPRVLQEHSGNRQHHEYKFSQDYEQKCSTTLSPGNSQSRLPLRTQHFYTTQQHTTAHQPWRSGYARPSYGRSHYPTPAEKDAQARRLLRRFHAAEGYSKYRARQLKPDDKNGDQKWPDHLEQAFFRALVEYPPMGRKKHLFKEKQRGRNELIADWIEMATGHSRNRKQISSHIQVLKHFVSTDRQIMQFLSKTTREEESSRYHSSYGSTHTGGRGLSRYPVAAPPHSGRQVLPLRVLGDAGNHGKLRNVPDIFEPVSFEMFVQRKFASDDQSFDDCVERLHTYTKQIAKPWEVEDVCADWDTFTQRYPHLATIHAQRPIDCNVIAAQASLAIHLGPWRDKEGEPVGNAGNELGISFHCRIGQLPQLFRARLPGSFEVICQNSFYEGGKLVEKNSCVETFIDDGSHNEMQVKFGSAYWVRALSVRYREACEAGPEHGAAFIGSITATQDVFIRTEAGMERVTLIHWSLRQSTGEQGRASWRKVVLPAQTSDSQTASPSKPLQIDTAFNFNDDPMPNLTASGAPPQPTLQSPFEYDSGADPESGSTFPSASWSNSMAETGDAVFANSSMDINLDSTFDFSADDVDMQYDPNMYLGLDSFDTSAFNFDAAASDFATDSAMQDYSQTWAEGYTESFDGQQSFAETNYTGSAALDSQAGGLNDYGVFDPQMYGASQETQAFGGAGQEVVREQTSLDVMASAALFGIQVAIETQEPVVVKDEQIGQM